MPSPIQIAPPSVKSGVTGQHAIVVGGSIAGLLAAEVLGQRFERVTLIERDAFPDGAEPRKGVPQSRQTHGLLASGRQALERLFPGFTADVLEQGAVPSDVLADTLWFFEGGWLARKREGLDGLLLSRPFIESAIRRRVLQRTNLVRRDDCAIDALTLTNGRVTGVRIGNELVTADLVVDATGRGSKTPQWLEELGFARPTEERVEVGIKYMTRRFERRENAPGDANAVIIPPTPDGKRGGVMLAQERGAWTVTLISNFCDAPPADLDAFVSYAQTLPSPIIHDVIRDAKPLGDALPHHFPFSVRRRYELLKQFPDRLIVMGDAMCSFNPIYGQGMSVSAQEALALGAAVDAGLEQLPRRFFKRAAAIVDIPWGIAVGSDLRIPETIGPRNAGVSFVNWYLAKLHRAAHHDAALSYCFMRVANLIAPPPTIFAPPVVFRVMRGNWKRRHNERHVHAAVAAR